MRFLLIPYFLFFSLGFLHVASAQNDTIYPSKSYTTQLKKGDIVIDGYLDENAWDNVEWGGDFVGFQPEFMVRPTEQTKFKILYDAHYLYIGIHALDSDPEKIVKRMSRRDSFDGDWVEINIDSYHDKRNAFSFTASVSGVKNDEFISNNGNNWDSKWNPIWYLKTSIDSSGWIAEFKIPLSQLRFAEKEEHVWGIQLTRRLFRKEERSTWQPISPTAPGWVYLFGELKGLVGIKPQKQLEVQPYIVSKYETFEKEEGDPYRTGKKFSNEVGVDAKVGITSDVTLDVTINPDFGQVEADPSTVNLSAFRLFFEERRDFFLEGSSLLSFPTSSERNNLFYSRRVGSRPKGNLDIHEDIEYIDKLPPSKILGSAKITGKNAKGFSWGILESFVNRTKVKVTDSLGRERKEMIEPYTNFLVGRFQQDLKEGKTVFGTIATHTKRFNNQVNDLDKLHNSAQSIGFDINHNFKERKYGFIAKVMMSKVNGSVDAIHTTQTASERLFQRPNNDYRELDTTRTSLIGSAATLSFEKRSGNWRWAVGSNYRSPSLSINDAGFLTETDNINNWFWTQYRVTKPNKFFRSQSYQLYYEQNIDFGGTTKNSKLNPNIRFELNNLWSFGIFGSVDGPRISNADLRGGPSIAYPGGGLYGARMATNQQKKVSLSFQYWKYMGEFDHVEAEQFRTRLTLQPFDAVRISLSGLYRKRRRNLQYITTTENNANEDYILGRVLQNTFNLSWRSNISITPNLTIELWMQPFIATGEYDHFKKVTQSTAEDFQDRFIQFAPADVLFNANDATYTIQDVDKTHLFDSPNFSDIQFRANGVLRWEYIPGSTLFLVWSNNASSDNVSTENSFSNLYNELFDLKGNNTFLIKYTYRFIKK